MTRHRIRDRLRIVDAATHAELLRGFRTLIPSGPALHERLSAVVRDSLDHPGSLIRAQLAHATLTHLGTPAAHALRMAVAIEYFHGASLLFDDLPSMDDGSERRGRPCPHLVFGEGATTLAGLGFINQAYALLWSVFARLPEARRQAAADLVTDCLGLAGILDGQCRDLHFGDGPRTAESAQRAAAGKTVPLIRLTLVLPALVGGADEVTLGSLERLSAAWGLAYQILDDFRDRLMAADETGKSTLRDGLLDRPNLPLTEGEDAALARLDHLLAMAGEALGQRGAALRRWRHLRRLHALLSDERAAVAARLTVAA